MTGKSRSWQPRQCYKLVTLKVMTIRGVSGIFTAVQKQKNFHYQPKNPDFIGIRSLPSPEIATAANKNTTPNQPASPRSKQSTRTKREPNQH